MSMHYYDIGSVTQVYNLIHAAPCVDGSAVATTICIGSENITTGSNVAQTPTSAATTPLYVNREAGYWSYILQVVVSSLCDDASDAIAITSMKMQSSTDGANWVDMTGVNSSTTTNYTPSTGVSYPLPYKQIWLNRTGVLNGGANANSNVVPMPGAAGSPLSGLTLATCTEAQIEALMPLGSGCFVDQPYTWTTAAGIGAPSAGVSVMLDARIFGSLRHASEVGTYLAPYVRITATGDADNATTVDVNLMLAASDHAPVISSASTVMGTPTAYYSAGQ